MQKFVAIFMIAALSGVTLDVIAGCPPTQTPTQCVEEAKNETYDLRPTNPDMEAGGELIETLPTNPTGPQAEKVADWAECIGAPPESGSSMMGSLRRSAHEEETLL